MSNNKQQTAVSFFLMGLIDLEIGKGIATDKVKELHYLFDKAKEMEKEQIMMAVKDSWYMAKGSNFQEPQEKQYYEQTSGGNNEQQ
jgi:hypothetical protein